MLAERVREARDADEPGVRRDHQDRGGEDADPGPEDRLEPADLVGQEAHEPEHRVFDVIEAELGAVQVGDRALRRLHDRAFGLLSRDDVALALGLDRDEDRLLGVRGERVRTLGLRRGRPRPAPSGPSRIDRHRVEPTFIAERPASGMPM